MDEMKGNHIIRVLRKKWIAYTILSDLMISSGASILLAIFSNKLFDWSVWWGILFFILIFAVLFLIHRVWTTNVNAITQLLDEKYPKLEESSGLLLQPLSSLNSLERLQYHKTQHSLFVIPAPLKMVNKLAIPALIVAIALAGSVVLYKVSFKQKINIPVAENSNRMSPTEIILPQIAGIDISITPPAYTGKNKRQQQSFSMVAEEGSSVGWQLKTNIAAMRIKFIFNDTFQVALHASDVNRTQWYLDKKIDSNGFYQVSIDDKISDLYTIEIIKDKPPVVLLQSPKQYTTIDFGEPQQVKINTVISDDYGVKDAFISATIASGSGEAVKFKEHKISFPVFITGKTQYQLQQLLSLPQLGMQPGDELYFYVQASDNHQQQTKSDIYIVHLPDTAQLMSLDGMSNSLTLKPEYFRSQRQIIIETEQLLKDKDTISEGRFKNLSNNLGIDQKLLRLRYGKFLGDENESGQNDSHELEDLSNFSNADKITDAYTDKHDNSEDATFYEPAIKRQLRATLTEMWAAEMRLRMFTPQAALPFEYKALRLLKDLQQKSRAYVAKTNLKTTPLDLKKRLTGDLSKIDPPTLRKDLRQAPDLRIAVRNALSLLEQMKTGDKQNIPIAMLQQANLYLREKAMQQPVVYLNAVEAMKKIIAAINTSGPQSAQDIIIAEQGLQQLLQRPVRLPSAGNDNSKQALSKQYFDNLQKKQP
ncbi:MAG: hypothetical protein ABJB86_24480 [Bacteroidota bacterium]